MCDLDDEYGPSVCRTSAVRARKEHRCIGCDETIRPGDRYCYTFGVWDGCAEGLHHCLRCYELIDILSDRVEGSVDLGLNCGETWENPPDDVAALAFMTRSEMQALAGKRGRQ